MSQYNQIANIYDIGPLDEYLFYSTWLNQCGDVSGLKILDIGCGSGISSRYLAKRGAKVTGVDNSSEMLELAKTEEDKSPLGIRYALYDVANLPHLDDFDLVTPSFLLHYATTKEELNAFALGIATNLKPCGRIVCINNNPEIPIQRYIPGLDNSSEWVDKPFAEGSRVRVHIHGSNGEKLYSFMRRFWKKESYEKTLSMAGFSEIRWVKLKMSEEGKKLIPNWKKIELMSDIIIITARKA